MRSSPWTPGSTRCGRPIGYARAERSGSSARSTTPQSGTALGQANGIQALDRSRQVIALCGDGGFNMLMCEFLTAVHHKLPVKVVVYNNSAFGLISFEAESVGLPAYKKGIEFPNPDFAALADVCGGYGFQGDEAWRAGDCDQRGFQGRRPCDHRRGRASRRDAQPSTYRPGYGRPFRHGQDQGSRPRRH